MFSKANNIVTKSRNRLLPNTIKKLIILKELDIISNKEEIINNNILFKNKSNTSINIINIISQGKNIVRNIEDNTINIKDNIIEDNSINIENATINIEEDSLEDKDTTSISSYNSRESRESIFNTIED